MKVRDIIFLTVLGFGFTTSAFAYQDVSLKERKAYKKVIRTRMPPSMFQDWVQNEFKTASKRWETNWQTFVVDDQNDRNSDEYFLIARSQDKPWAFGVEKQDCEKPENFETLKSQVMEGGSPVHLDCVVGIKKNKSFFRYQVTVYEPMYPFWKSPCYIWNLPAGSLKDPFYAKNYNMSKYSKNMADNIYALLSESLSEWKPPKQTKKIPQMKGPGQELIGGESDTLTDEERKLPIQEQEKILKKRQLELEKAKKSSR